MWHDARNPRQAIAAAARLLRLELRLMTGGRALIVLAAQVAWLVLWAVFQRFRDEPWEPVSFYNRTIVLPCLLPAVAFGMTCVLSERDDRHLEMTFASPGGRYLVWAFRFAALAAASAASCLVLGFGTRLLVGPEIPPVPAALHALVPVLMASALACCLALLLNGTSSAGLVTAGLFAASAIVLHQGGAGRFDPFLNPFDPPPGLRDPHAWLRLLVFNRMLLLSVTAASVAVSLGLLQRRERLL